MSRLGVKQIILHNVGRPIQPAESLNATKVNLFWTEKNGVRGLSLDWIINIPDNRFFI